MDLKHFSEKNFERKRYVKLKISLVLNPPPSLPKYLRQIPLDPTELYSAVRTLPITASESGEKNMIWNVGLCKTYPTTGISHQQVCKNQLQQQVVEPW